MPEQTSNAPFHLPDGIRFGRTEVIAVVGDLLSQGAEAVVIPANRRGVMGAISTPGLVGIRSLGGSDIERQAMANGTLELGTAIVTNATGLESRGINHVVHAVVHRALGEPARIEDVRRGVAAALVAADRVRARSLALPPLGVDSGPGRTDPAPFIAILVEETVAALRRSTLRFDTVIVACRFPDHADAVRAAFIRSRERSWTTSR
ncbi:MAG: macro domain-containing protein [Thermomicrobiales bacterium]